MVSCVREAQPLAERYTYKLNGIMSMLIQFATGDILGKSLKLYTARVSSLTLNTTIYYCGEPGISPLALDFI